MNGVLGFWGSHEEINEHGALFKLGAAGARLLSPIL